ncbi:hypothetical protein F441_05486 [Phytophthora nicotianae CJ01A1]|uniref:Uncharacterized protein n=2 Tax=Phytophthora nicotianae TaxID=4792 RepID=W2QFP8_PHYN3|nr:hypothetical protein PPTG_22558 [Phytophthora nicotianae INRA-310]ETN11997.1 hypothetical protein PPTG_22558 [Phytophthora nicotianae INRA-310]ETP20844.1 hypothetical protein F441_05486 [Phytophthora nicotianae CJ01A1]
MVACGIAALCRSCSLQDTLRSFTKLCAELERFYCCHVQENVDGKASPFDKQNLSLQIRFDLVVAYPDQFHEGGCLQFVCVLSSCQKRATKHGCWTNLRSL